MRDISYFLGYNNWKLTYDALLIRFTFETLFSILVCGNKTTDETEGLTDAWLYDQSSEVFCKQRRLYWYQCSLFTQQTASGWKM